MTTYIEKTCEYCDEEFEVPDWKSKRDRRFCSLECFNNHQRDNANRVDCVCQRCGDSFTVTQSSYERGEGKYCDRECYLKADKSGSNNGNWKGGRFVRDDGYVAIRVGDEYKLEHRHVMEQKIGRELVTAEHVHHKDGDKSNNDPSNLEILWVDEHASLHHDGKDEDKWVEVECFQCEQKTERRKVELERHPRTYCSRSCYKKGSSRTPAKNRLDEEVERKAEENLQRIENE